MTQPSSTVADLPSPLVPPALARVIGRLFSSLVLTPIRLAGGALGDPFWDPLARVSAQLAAGVGRSARLVLREKETPLASAMSLVDLVENLVDVVGDWQILDDRTVIRRVHRCPHAVQLRSTPIFCTRIGELLGQEVLAAFLPDHRVQFRIDSTLSQGHPCCEYRLTLDR